jgi:hypothetical protein
MALRSVRFTELLRAARASGEVGSPQVSSRYHAAAGALSAEAAGRRAYGQPARGSKLNSSFIR